MFENFQKIAYKSSAFILSAALVVFVNTSFQVCSIRILSYIFPVQMMFAISLVTSIAIFASGIGALLSKKLRHSHDFILLLAGITTILSLALLNSLHLFPRILNLSIIAASIILIIPFCLLGCLSGIYFLRVFETEKSAVKWLIVTMSIFFFAGYSTSTLLLQKVGIWNISIFLSIMLLLRFITTKHFFKGLVLFLIILAITNPGPKIFSKLSKKPLLWVPSNKEYKHIFGFWSPYSRLDFIDLGNGRLAGLYNGVQYWITGSPSFDVGIRRHLYNTLTGNVLVIGSGGGHGLLSLNNAKKISAVELDPGVISFLKGPLSKYNSNIYNKIDTTFAGDGRAFIEKTDKKYDSIIYEAVEGNFFNSPRSFISLENYLYTKEGIKKAFNRLKTNGQLLIIHTEGTIPISKVINNFEKNIYWKTWRGFIVNESLPKINFLITVASKSKTTLNKTNNIITGSSFPIEDITESPEIRYGIRNSSLITDNRPTLHFHSWIQFLPFLIVLAILSVILFIIIFLQKNKILSLYFSSIGISFILLELYILNMLRSLLGGYVETTSVALGILTIAVSIGTIFFNKISKKQITLGIISSGIILYLLIHNIPAGSPIWLKILWMISTIFPIGFMMGYFFPYGMMLSSTEKSALYYAIDTIGTAIGFIVFYLTILVVGFNGVFLSSIILYIIAIILLSKKL